MRFPQPPYSEKLIQSTLDHWGPLYKEKEGKELTKADAEEIRDTCQVPVCLARQGQAELMCYF